MNLHCSFTVIFWLVALIASLFYGWKAHDVFSVKTSAMRWAWHVHQFWFNLSGSAGFA